MVAGVASAAANLVSIFAPESELATNLALFNESASEQFNIFSQNARQSLDGVFGTEISDQITSFLDNVPTKFAEANENIAQGLKNTEQVAKRATFNISNALGGGIASGVQNLTNALIQEPH